MIEVKLFEKDMNEILDIVNELKQRGLIINRDFDFAYSPGNHDYYVTDDSIPISVSFTFYEESFASWFALKYI